MKEKGDWWHDFFPSFRPVFDIIDSKATNAQVRYLIKKLDLKPGKSFLDCPCGIGRISIPMARKGIKVTGVDIMASYLDELDKRAKRTKLNIKLFENDMRRVNFKNEFDAAANIWTSFGFFEKESDDLLVLKKMFQALRPGGKFLVHLINRDYIVSDFMPRDWFNAGKARVFQEMKFDFRTSKLRGIWRFIKDGVEKEHEVLLRLYSYHELCGMMVKVGFVDVQGYGSAKDDPISHNTNRMIIIGTKPKRQLYN